MLISLLACGYYCCLCSLVDTFTIIDKRKIGFHCQFVSHKGNILTCTQNMKYDIFQCLFMVISDLRMNLNTQILSN